MSVDGTTTLTDPATRPRRPEGTHSTMTTPTSIATVSLDVVRAALVKGATFLRCSIWCAGLGLHLLSNATGSRDAP